MDTTAGVRSVVGVRGSYPGRFAFHDNRPNRFNDTIVLLWVDAEGPHVREFPANTDTGAHNFGGEDTSSLRPNRRYRYTNGWHRSYNALAQAQYGYRVRADANGNGHWDSDRNGWLGPGSERDYDRTGSGHNIHMGSMNAPLGTAAIGSWSAGRQVIPGMANWEEFITNAWTGSGDGVDYFLVDVRDINPQVWTGCTPDGTHSCPYVVSGFPFTVSGDTSAVSTSRFDFYNCAPSTNESGPEIVYVLTVDRSGTITATVTDSDTVDVDVHILDADDARACLNRNDATATASVGPGRYFVVADTYVSNGTPLPGPFTLTISFQ
ncbi:MAG: hypothetical protein ACOX6T_08395 [Myxococcales bacterium]|jgi:hypothetical protein